MKGSQLGYILNSDMTVTASKQSGKTPIGVVVCSYSGNTGGQAMALDSIGKYKWLSNYLDIPTLPNNSTRDGAYKDTSSCENTAKIIAAGDSSAFPAAWAAHEYSTEGTSAGDWCLPAAGVFTSYYADQSVINSGFTLAGGTILTTSNNIWSSSENNTSTAWNSYFYGIYALESYNKTTSRDVRPVIEF